MNANPTIANATPITSSLLNLDSFINDHTASIRLTQDEIDLLSSIFYTAERRESREIRFSIYKWLCILNSLRLDPLLHETRDRFLYLIDEEFKHLSVARLLEHDATRGYSLRILDILNRSSRGPVTRPILPTNNVNFGGQRLALDESIDFYYENNDGKNMSTNSNLTQVVSEFSNVANLESSKVEQLISSSLRVGIPVIRDRIKLELSKIFNIPAQNIWHPTDCEGLGDLRSVLWCLVNTYIAEWIALVHNNEMNIIGSEIASETGHSVDLDSGNNSLRDLGHEIINSIVVKGDAAADDVIKLIDSFIQGAQYKSSIVGQYLFQLLETIKNYYASDNRYKLILLNESIVSDLKTIILPDNEPLDFDNESLIDIDNESLEIDDESLEIDDEVDEIENKTEKKDARGERVAFSDDDAVENSTTCDTCRKHYQVEGSDTRPLDTGVKFTFSTSKKVPCVTLNRTTIYKILSKYPKLLREGDKCNVIQFDTCPIKTKFILSIFCYYKNREIVLSGNEVTLKRLNDNLIPYQLSADVRTLFNQLKEGVVFDGNYEKFSNLVRSSRLLATEILEIANVFLFNANGLVCFSIAAELYQYFFNIPFNASQIYAILSKLTRDDIRKIDTLHSNECSYFELTDKSEDNLRRTLNILYGNEKPSPGLKTVDFSRAKEKIQNNLKDVNSCETAINTIHTEELLEYEIVDYYWHFCKTNKENDDDVNLYAICSLILYSDASILTKTCIYNALKTNSHSILDKKTTLDMASELASELQSTNRNRSIRVYKTVTCSLSESIYDIYSQLINLQVPINRCIPDLLDYIRATKDYSVLKLISYSEL